MAVPQSKPAEPPTLDYAPPPSRSLGGDRVVLLGIGLLCGLIGLGVAIGTVGVCVGTWPSFGMTLIAVPVELVAFAFVAVGVASIRVAVTADTP